ncbi:MAG: exonuclease SbcCD subunit D [Pseudomonadales bacterium]|nr:exonuclease SbcCD subunit D [Pseudomonadales bacterium]MCP5183106.1 exonuclease SbcCD subunit D [Pseudomonadales bacterium]
MKILHTSDWHLGRQLYNVSLLEDQRHVLMQIVEIARTRGVDVVLVAGDIYDRSVPAADAVALLDDIIHAFAELGIALVMIAGNHDGPERLAFAGRLLARLGVHITGPLLPTPEPVVLQDAHGPVAFHALPYADPPTVRAVLGVDVQGHEQAMQALVANLRERQPPRCRSVVVAHCFLDGYAASESERPLAVGGVQTVSAACFEGFDYVALGHLHGPQARGAAHLRYSGSILKYSFSEEKQRKSITLVDLDGDGRCTVEQVDLTPLRDVRTVEGLLADILAAGKQDSQREDYIQARLLDERAILDPMGKLRAVYPNALHIEMVALNRTGDGHGPSRDALARGEMPLFRDFWRAVTDEELDDDDARIVAGMLERIHAGGES